MRTGWRLLSSGAQRVPRGTLLLLTPPQSAPPPLPPPSSAPAVLPCLPYPPEQHRASHARPSRCSTSGLVLVVRLCVLLVERARTRREQAAAVRGEVCLKNAELTHELTQSSRTSSRRARAELHAGRFSRSRPMDKEKSTLQPAQGSTGSFRPDRDRRVQSARPARGRPSSRRPFVRTTADSRQQTSAT